MPNDHVHEEAHPGDIDLARDLLQDMQVVQTKSSDKALRHQLRSHAVACLGAGTCLNLSDPNSPLGELMAKANARAREMGWL